MFCCALLLPVTHELYDLSGRWGFHVLVVHVELPKLEIVTTNKLNRLKTFQ